MICDWADQLNPFDEMNWISERESSFNWMDLAYIKE